MSILGKMSKSFKIATSDTKSSDIEIDELIQYSKIDVPLEFLESRIYNVREIRKNFIN